MSFIEVIRSWLPADKLDKGADEIYEFLLQQRLRLGRNLGIDLANDDPEIVLVVQRALKRHPDMEVVCNAKNYTLALRKDFNAQTSKELRDKLSESGLVGAENVVMPPEKK